MVVDRKVDIRPVPLRASSSCPGKFFFSSSRTLLLLFFFFFLAKDLRKSILYYILYTWRGDTIISDFICHSRDPGKRVRCEMAKVAIGSKQVHVIKFSYLSLKCSYFPLFFVFFVFSLTVYMCIIFPYFVLIFVYCHLCCKEMN